NFVAEPEGEAAAVLIRALQPTAGLEAMRERRGERPEGELCSGPGKLTEALGVGLEHNDADLGRDPFLLLPPEGEPPAVVTGPRIGITKAVERPWRFCAAGSRFVSKPWPA
ncbi:MAG TPA: DNA-3-methyladenine glycosylase, partial [Solirubrobacterales bacterium]|nr:DNA-3-methyladenine glycosylase [Solirubrobacterales bacterium]